MGLPPKRLTALYITRMGRKSKVVAMIAKKLAMLARNSLLSARLPSMPKRPLAVSSDLRPMMMAAPTKAGMMGMKMSENTLSTAKNLPFLSASLALTSEALISLVPVSSMNAS